MKLLEHSDIIVKLENYKEEFDERLDELKKDLYSQNFDFAYLEDVIRYFKGKLDLATTDSAVWIEVNIETNNN